MLPFCSFGQKLGGYFGKKNSIGFSYSINTFRLFRSALKEYVKYDCKLNYGISLEHTLNRKNSVIVGFQQYLSEYTFNYYNPSSFRYTTHTLNLVTRNTVFVGYKISFLNKGSINPVGWFYTIGLFRNSIHFKTASDELQSVKIEEANERFSWFGMMNEFGKVIPLNKNATITISNTININSLKTIYYDFNEYNVSFDNSRSSNLNKLLSSMVGTYKLENCFNLKVGLNYYF